VDLANIISGKRFRFSLERRANGSLRVRETKGCFSLTVCDLSRYFGDVLVEGSTHKVIIAENKCFLKVEPNCNDIARVLSGERSCFIYCKFMLEQELLVICEFVIRNDFHQDEG
jgi:hypothetical protein